MCFIEKEIAKHCDDSEVHCEMCGSTMTFDYLRHEILVCDNCAHELDTDPDLN